MEAKHTSGKLTVKYWVTGINIVSDETGQPVVMRHGPSNVQTRAVDFERLTDCWNALVGLNPEAVRDVVEALDHAVNTIPTEIGSKMNCVGIDAVEWLAHALAKLKAGQ